MEGEGDIFFICDSTEMKRSSDFFSVSERHCWAVVLGLNRLVFLPNLDYFDGGLFHLAALRSYFSSMFHVFIQLNGLHGKMVN